MKLSLALLGAACGALLVLLPAAASNGQAGRPEWAAVARLAVAGHGWSGGELTSAHLEADGLASTGEIGPDRDGLLRGWYLSAVQPLENSFDLARGQLLLEQGRGGQAELEVRSSADALRWSSWMAVTGEQFTSLPAGRFLQYRVELAGEPGEQPLVRVLDLELASSGAMPLQGPGENPTVRLFATREGMVGRKTANGHVIGERDHFVALPSKRVLNAEGKRDYQVQITYKGKTATAPVWDVGPWNTRDNYWDERRDLFTDLPRFTPQALAAWQSGYNGGRDQFARWVSLPASIDLADGTFLDDLGMRNSDWVDVTLLWVNASSPPSAELPTVSGLKPEPKAAGPVPLGQLWLFVDGNTKPPFETWFVLENPGEEPAKAYLNYLMPDGEVERQEVTLNGTSRAAIYANQTVPGKEFATRIEATRPIMAERSMYFGSDGHTSTGLTAPSTTWYLTDGRTQSPFDTWVLLHNPGTGTANVVITFMKDGGETQPHSLTVPPAARRDVHLNDVITQSEFAMKIVSDQPVVAERTVYLVNGGGYATVASPATARHWYLAEGSTMDGFETRIIVQNPGRAAANVSLAYLRQDGAPIQQKVAVAAASRTVVQTREIVSGERFGLKVESDQPVVVERAMYFGGATDGQGLGAHASLGAPDLAGTWYLPEGSTQSPAREQLLAANPGDTAAHLRVDFIRASGEVTTREYDLAPMRRLTVEVNAEVPNQALSARVTSDQPIVIERSSYFGSNGGTNSLGIPR